MGKQYDEHGDVILTEDQKDLCKMANFLYEAVDQLLCLEDEKGFNLHPAAEIYEDACQKLKEMMK